MDISITLRWYNSQRLELEELYRQGKLVRHEGWCLEYYMSPYLLFSGNEELRQRFIDIFANVCDLDKNGKITPDPRLREGDVTHTRNFTQIIEAWNSRGGTPSDLIEMGRTEFQKYFENGDPLGVAMFKGLPVRRKGVIVKFSKREFLETLLAKGRMRLAPASYYSQGSLLKSMKDLETVRTLRVSAIKDALAGKTHIQYQGKWLPIDGGAISINVEARNYYLFSSCIEFDRRMPTDFGADAALVIEDVPKFERLAKKTIKRKLGQADVRAGPVFYFDPFRPPRKRFEPEFIKHFAYAYQKEHRIVARPYGEQPIHEPIFVEIGPMSDYAFIVP